MVNWNDNVPCGDCREDLPLSGWKWRRVWSDRERRYRRRKVHAACADKLDALGTAQPLFDAGRQRDVA